MEALGNTLFNSITLLIDLYIYIYVFASIMSFYLFQTVSRLKSSLLTSGAKAGYGDCDSFHRSPERMV